MNHRQPILAILLPATLVVGAAGIAWGTGGVYTQTRHGDPTDGVARLAGEPVGDCAQCHDQHASRDGSPTGGPHPYALFAPDDDALCATAGCHVGPGAIGIYPGPLAHEQGAHFTSPQTVWPGPVPRARSAGDAGACVNCHTPHGRADPLGLLPSLTTVREEGSCLRCHDASGPAASDIESDINRPHRHPVRQHADRHDATESQPADFAFNRRHAECVDCHNPHDLASDPFAPSAPAASQRLGRVSRVAVVNGAAGSMPAYTFLPADDPSPILEYQVCFKCHASWTTLQGGRPDLGLQLNPNNPSYHPVEAPGSDPDIDPASFVNGLSASDTIYCGDCHGSDDPARRGPHGSSNAGLLLAPYAASPAPRPADAQELCFRCHAFDTYADKDAPTTVQGASRWNEPSDDGHAKHADEDVPCYACHTTHGSTTLPHLLVLGRTPGLVSWSVDLGGTRSCASTCHGPESYDPNY